MLRWSASKRLSGTLGTNSTRPSSLPVGSTLQAIAGKSFLGKGRHAACSYRVQGSQSGVGRQLR